MRISPLIGARIDAPPSLPTATTLTVGIADSADPVETEDTFTYTVSSTNTGGATALDVVISVALDAALTFVSASGTGWTCAHYNGVVTCRRDTLAVGAAPNITVTVTAGVEADTYSTTATATSRHNADAPTVISDTETTVVELPPMWTIDVTSDIGVPADADEWDAVLDEAGIASGGPSHVYGCQVASGDLTDAVGSLAWTAQGTRSYQNAITGWTRKGVGTTDGANGGWTIGAGAGPDPSVTSVLYLTYMRIDSAVGAGNFISAGAAGALFVADYVNANGTIVSVGGNIATDLATGVVNYEGGAVFPLVMRHDITNLAAGSFTDAEKIAHSIAAVVDGLKYLGNDGVVQSPPCGAMFLYFAIFEGAAAELSNAQIKTLLQTLGWTVPWTP